MIIIVTGTPATGKTTVAKALAKEMHFLYFDVNTVIQEKNLEDSFDEKRNSAIVDEEKLVTALLEEIQKGRDLVIDSHLSHELPASVVDLCIVTACALPELKKRLESRDYSPEKVRENMDAEIFAVCEIEAREAGHTVLVLETGKDDVALLVQEVKDEINRNKR